MTFELKDSRIGIVSWMARRKGFGVIVDPETGSEYFFHFSAIRIGVHEKRFLYPGEEVTFVEGNLNGKPLAFNIKKQCKILC